MTPSDTLGPRRQGDRADDRAGRDGDDDVVGAELRQGPSAGDPDEGHREGVDDEGAHGGVRRLRPRGPELCEERHGCAVPVPSSAHGRSCRDPPAAMTLRSRVHPFG